MDSDQNTGFPVMPPPPPAMNKKRKTCPGSEFIVLPGMGWVIPPRPPPPSPLPNILLPTCSLLDHVGQIEDRDNNTTAKCRASYGYTVKVTFVLAEPPRLSYFCVHCPGLKSRFDYGGSPRIHFSLNNVALISVTFGLASSHRTDYFFYKPSSGHGPSLEYLKDVGDYLKEKDAAVFSMGFLPCDGHDDDYVLVALVCLLDAKQVGFHVFRSKQGTWTCKVLQGQQKNFCSIERVLALGSGELGFVDLWRGILVCDVRVDDDPAVRFIPLPALLPENKDKDKMGNGRIIRDVAFQDGVLKCVEIEHFFQLVVRETHRHDEVLDGHEELPDDVSTMDELHDSDLLREKPAPKQVEEVYKYVGCRLIAWARTLSSTSWRKECLFHANDIRGNDPTRVSEPVVDLGDSNKTMKELYMTVPTLNMDDTNSLYLVSNFFNYKAEPKGEELRVFKVDMGNKTLEGFSPILKQGQDYYSRITCSSCSLFQHLDADSSN